MIWWHFIIAFWFGGFVCYAVGYYNSLVHGGYWELTKKLTPFTRNYSAFYTIFSRSLFWFIHLLKGEF
jgi:hypothetical protein